MGDEDGVQPGADVIRRFRNLYGAGPLHLLALIASFALAGAGVVGWYQRPLDLHQVLEYFFAALIGHDLVLVPLYSLLDRIAFSRARSKDAAGDAAARAAGGAAGGSGGAAVDAAGGSAGAVVDADERSAEAAVRTTGRPATRKASPPRRHEPVSPVSAVAYVRVPAILSGLLLIVFFPDILSLGPTYTAASGLGRSIYLSHWLAATGVMFALSGIAYAFAVRRAREATARV